jgi:gluconokinase
MDYVLGIDIGTGSTKAVAVELGGKPLADAQEMYGFQSPKPGYHEQDPGQIWLAFSSCVKQVIEKLGERPKAAGLSSALHSLIVVDEDGRALAPMMTWADNRSFEIAKKLRASAEGMAIYRATGTPLHAMSPLCKIIWLRQNEPQLFEQAARFISIKEYIWHKLFDEFAVDHSIASGTGMFDVLKLQWHPQSLALAGISAGRLSTPQPTSYTVKCPTGEIFPAGTPITIAASDGPLANLGSMADKPGIAAITIGTSGAVRAASDKPLPNDRAMTFSYILDEHTFICGGPTNNGGIALQWWIKNFGGGDLSGKNYDVLFREIEGIPAGSEGLIFLPYLSGERAPIWDSESSGNFFGVRLAHTHAHFSRAVLEGICFALKDVLNAVEENSGLVKQVNISGGFTKSKVWVQMLADITGKKLAIVQAEDASAVGAAMLAIKSAGLSENYPVLADSGEIFPPIEENVKVYQHQLKVYRILYTNLKGTMHATANI